MKRLWRDRRGNALVIAGAALPVVVGGAGLATDTIQWTMWKRELQRTADSAAYAGVYARAQDNGSMTAAQAVNLDLQNNNTTGITILSGFPQLAYPTSSTYSHAVQVTLAIQKTLGFSSLFMSAAPTITATGTAALFDEGEHCVFGLKKGPGPAIIIGGSANTLMGCSAISNSGSNPSVATNGNAYNFDAPTMSGAGDMPDEVTGVDVVKEYQMPAPDPFKDKYSTDIPPSETCGNQNSHVVSNNGGTKTLSPGCYTGNNSFKFTAGDWVLQPGVYYLNNLDFDASGGVNITGTDVTIILTGSTPGSIKTNGNANIQLSAPATGPYAKMLFIQAAGAVEDNLNEINGSNTSSYDGALYFPNGKVQFSGSTAAMTKCAMVVAYTVEFTGNSNLQNNTTGCTGNMTAPIKKIRLIA